MPGISEFRYDLSYAQAKLAERLPPNANLALQLDKYIGHYFNLDRNNDPTGEKQIGKQWLGKVFISRYDAARNSPEYRQMFQSYLARWRAFLDQQNAGRRQLQTTWRAAIHLGRTSVAENATIALHRTYGFPYIPGQSLKGLTHAYSELVAHPNDPEKVHSLFGQLLTDNLKQLVKKRVAEGQYTKEKGKELLDMRQGSVVFFDAVPTSLPNLELDILNAHFPDWYGKKSSVPSDNQSPVPVNFLTIAPNSSFLFAVASAANQRDNTTDVDLALNLLQKALEELGVGAKTAAGYGQFSE